MDGSVVEGVVDFGEVGGDVGAGDELGASEMSTGSAGTTGGPTRTAITKANSTGTAAMQASRAGQRTNFTAPPLRLLVDDRCGFIIAVLGEPMMKPG